MSNRQITIAIVAMGGENSPYKILKGTEIFTSKYSDVKIVFFGNKISIEKILYLDDGKKKIIGNPIIQGMKLEAVLN